MFETSIVEMQDLYWVEQDMVWAFERFESLDCLGFGTNVQKTCSAYLDL